jgi:splicing factor 3A subunit 3
MADFKNNALFCSFTVWEKIKYQKTTERWQPEVEEEFEDSMGNVVNKKTFEDLKRQGLL